MTTEPRAPYAHSFRRLFQHLTYGRWALLRDTGPTVEVLLHERAAPDQQDHSPQQAQDRAGGVEPVESALLDQRRPHSREATM